jgi:plastocyanin
MTGRAVVFMAVSVAATVGILAAPAPGGGEGAGARAAPAPKSDLVRIRVKDNFFEPRSTTIGQDGRVLWLWRGSNRHNVVFTKVPQDASRRGAATRADGRWKRSFGVPGLYRYVCRIYAGMRGTITVEPPGPAAGGHR